MSFKGGVKIVVTVSILAGGAVGFWLFSHTWSSTTIVNTNLLSQTVEVPVGGFLLASGSTLKITDATRQVIGETSFSGDIQGLFIQPATHHPLVIMTDGSTWAIWDMDQTNPRVIYSSKIAFSDCDLARNGHALICIQAGDLNLIRIKTGASERLDTGVVAATWSPNSTDILVQYADHTDLLGLDLDDHLASHTPLIAESGVSPEFIDASQVVWWQGDDVARQLVLFSLETKVKTVIWTGLAAPQMWLNVVGNRLAFTDNLNCDPSCTTTVISLPDGTIQQTVSDAVPVGWLGTQVVMRQPVSPIDPGLITKYHFSALNDDQTLTDLGSGLSLITATTLHAFFTQ